MQRKGIFQILKINGFAELFRAVLLSNPMKITCTLFRAMTQITFFKVFWYILLKIINTSIDFSSESKQWANLNNTLRCNGEGYWDKWFNYARCKDPAGKIMINSATFYYFQTRLHQSNGLNLKPHPKKTIKLGRIMMQCRVKTIQMLRKDRRSMVTRTRISLKYFVHSVFFNALMIVFSMLIARWASNPMNKYWHISSWCTL